MSKLFDMVGGLLDSLLGGNEPAPAPAAAPAAAPAPLASTPVIAPVPVMPVVDDAAVQMAKKRSIAAQQQRRGRASTILTDQTNDPLGG